MLCTRMHGVRQSSLCAVSVFVNDQCKCRSNFDCNYSLNLYLLLQVYTRNIILLPIRHKMNSLCTIRIYYHSTVSMVIGLMDCHNIRVLYLIPSYCPMEMLGSQHYLIDWDIFVNLLNLICI